MAVQGTTLPLEQFCRLLDLTPQRISQLVREGILEKAGRGEYEVAKNVRSYIQFLRSGHQAKIASMAESKQRKLAADADISELELAKARESIITIADHGNIIGRIADLIKGRLLAMPSRLATDLSMAANQNICKSLVENEARETLTEFSRLVGDLEGRLASGKNTAKDTGKKISATSKINSRRVGRPRKGSVT